MPPTPLVEWGDDERAAGAVSFLERLLNSTTPKPTVMTTTLPPLVKQVKEAVVKVLPHLADMVVNEVTPVYISNEPTTITTPSTTSAPPPTFTATTPSCTPDPTQVILIFNFNMQ
jgi:hypothetical protein